VESELDRGSSFVVCLPLAQQPAKEPPVIDVSILGKGVVLVVEDESFLQRTAEKTLEFLGYEELTANDGLEALEIYRQEQSRIDVVLLDMFMPKMNGSDCLVELKRINPEVRVVATSGLCSPGDVQEMLSLGATDQLPKPYRRVDLSEAISRAISRVDSPVS